MSEPGQWLQSISKATWTLLMAAVAVFVAWQVFQRLLPAFLIIAGLIAIYRLVLSGRHRGW